MSLRFERRFVDALPGDPVSENYCRRVDGAAYSRVTPSEAPAPTLLALVPEVCALLGLVPEETPELVDVLAGNRLLPGMEPYAACYGGHQFGQWAGQLGDGRAVTLGEVRAPGGDVFEIQLKGAGRTPYSRSADGRAVLRSSLRELVCSEAMHHLGIPTTRALSLVTTGAPVVRDMLYDGHPEAEPGAVVCRVAPSFLRFGNFELQAARGDEALLRQLVAFTVSSFYPALMAEGQPDVPAFFEEVCRRTARLVVEWTRVGFVHGVMNTDNMSILGLTIDYGPYGWLDVFDPSFTPNITDSGGRRYAFGNQPRIGLWNLVALARALAPLVADESALERGLQAFGEYLEREHRTMMLAKLGLAPLPEHQSADEDDALAADLLALLTEVETDMTLFFRRLGELRLAGDAARSSDAWLAPLRDAFYNPDAIPPAVATAHAAWLVRYAERAKREGVDDASRSLRMGLVNPLYVPRNYLVHEVIEASKTDGGAALAELLDVLRRPYAVQPGRDRFAAKRPDWARAKAGCSMLSCSS